MDLTFGAGTGYVPVIFVPNRQESVERVLLQADGKIVLVGLSHDQPLTFTAPAVARFEADGRADAGFDSGGVVVFKAELDYELGAVLSQTDDRIVIGALNHERPSRTTLARFTSTGELDRAFGNDGHAPYASQKVPVSILQDLQGRLIAVGQSPSSTSLFANMSAEGTPDYIATGYPGEYRSLALLESVPRCVAVGDLYGTPALFGLRLTTALAEPVDDN